MDRGKRLRDSKDDRILVKEVLAAKDEAEAVAELGAGGVKAPFRWAPGSHRARWSP